MGRSSLQEAQTKIDAYFLKKDVVLIMIVLVKKKIMQICKSISRHYRTFSFYLLGLQ